MCIKLVGGGYQNKGIYVESLMTKLREGYKANPRNMSDNMKMVALISTYMEKVGQPCFSSYEHAMFCVLLTGKIMYVYNKLNGFPNQFMTTC